MPSLLDEADRTGIAGLSLSRKCREYGKPSELTADREDQEVTMLALHLLQSLVYVNTIFLHRVLTRPECDRLTEEDRRALSPLFWTHVNPYSSFNLEMDHHLDLGPPPASS